MSFCVVRVQMRRILPIIYALYAYIILTCAGDRPYNIRTICVEHIDTSMNYPIGRDSTWIKTLLLHLSPTFDTDRAGSLVAWKVLGFPFRERRNSKR